MGNPRPPAGTGKAGRRLWVAVTADFDLDVHELVLLERASRVADACAELQDMQDVRGLMTGGRVAPWTVELRLQTLLLGRLIVALRVPLGEDEADDNSRPPARALRGVYSLSPVPRSSGAAEA